MTHNRLLIGVASGVIIGLFTLLLVIKYKHQDLATYGWRELRHVLNTNFPIHHESYGNLPQLFIPFSHTFQNSTNRTLSDPRLLEPFRISSPSVPLLESFFNCKTQINQTNSLHTSCKFESICMNRRGEWVIFSNSEYAIANSGKVWVYNNAYYLNQEFHRLRINVVPKPTQVIYRGYNDSVSVGNVTNTIILSKGFKWVHTPTFVTARHEMLNAGHAFLDNLLPLLHSLYSYELFDRDFNILFSDSFLHKREEANRGAMIERASLIYGKILTNTIIEKCADVNGHFIEKASCRWDKWDVSAESSELYGNELDVCFSTLVAGSHGPFFLDFTKGESLLPILRQKVMKALGITDNHLRPSKTYLILIQNKPQKTVNKDAVVNVEELVEYFTNNTKTILQTLNAQRQLQNHYTNVNVINLKLENLSLHDQLLLFLRADIYITTQGSASYMSMFMNNPRAVMIYTPMCFYEERKCSDSNLRIHRHFHNVKIVSLLDHLSIVKAVKTFEKNETGVDVMRLDNDLRHFGDCHERLDPFGLFDLVLKAISGVL